jgi:hypothetical protein
MTVGELKNILDYLDEDKEIRVAFQPSWPLRAKIQSVVDGEELSGERDDGYEDTPESAQFVWIAVDQVSSYSEHPYAPKEAWQ